MSQLQIRKPEHHYDFNDFLFGRWAEHARRIEERAHQLFEGRGREHGHDVEDWLQAEQEIDAESTLRTEAGDRSMTFILTTPGFDGDHLKVSIVPGMAVVEGETQRQESGEKDGVTFTEASVQALFRKIPLPETADVDAAAAEFRGGELRITVPLIAKKGAAGEDGAPITKAQSA